MNRVYNFSAGPSMLPLPVLEKAASELICYGESGMSVMEMSHRSPDYEAIINNVRAQRLARQLCHVKMIVGMIAKLMPLLANTLNQLRIVFCVRSYGKKSGVDAIFL